VDPDTWLETVPSQEGSWWPAWETWLCRKSSDRIPPPTIGSSDHGYGVLDDALTIRELLQAQDWAPFEARYQAGGRSPYAPDAVLGLVRYGMLNGVSSRRGREGLARRGLGYLWITGGRCPDQASIGRFTRLHEESLTGDFVTELTRPVLPITGTGVGPVAGDGPVVQATASNDHTIELEAAPRPGRKPKPSRLKRSPPPWSNARRVKLRARRRIA